MSHHMQRGALTVCPPTHLCMDVTEEHNMAQDVSSNEAVYVEGEEAPRKLTKAEKKALYKPAYEEPHGTRRKLLKEIFLNEKNEAMKDELIQSILYSIYDSDENPYDSMLQLHKICPDYTSVKPKSLAALTVAHFRSWLYKLDDPLALFERCVTTELQVDAFRIATAKHTGNLKLFKEIFCLDTPSLLPFIKEEVQSMVDHHMFKEAMGVVEEFHLQNEYGLNAFIIPCLLQDKLSSVVKFIESNKEIQKEFLSFLDSFVSLSEDEVMDRLKDYKDANVMTLPYERFTGKTVEKLIFKLASDLQLPIESVAPRFFRARKEGELRFKVQSRFAAGELSDDAYFGHVSEALRTGDEKLKMYFIRHLTSFRYYEDAVRWAVYCNISEDKLPHALQSYLINNPEAADEAEKNIRRMEKRAEDVGDGDADLFAGYPIMMVENKKQLYELMDKLNGQEFIGIDSEWKPQCMVPNESVALLQIAILDGVYLVDFCSRELKLTECDWDIFLQTLLCGPSKKVGFDLTNDLRALFAAASTPNIRSVVDNLCNVVCLKRLVENLLNADRYFLGNQIKDLDIAAQIEGDNDRDPGEDDAVIHFKLSDLSERLLDITLDKSEQRGNWSLRPLRKKQKAYAAMDAYIVIELYGELNKRAIARGLDFESFVQQSVVNGKKKDKVRLRKERVKMDDMTWAEICDKLSDVQSGTRPATQLQCIVDSMLLGLGKHLRRCGVNVLIPGDRSELKMRARGNSRIIVTSGKAYDELRRQFADRVLAIPNASALGPIEQLKCVFAKNKVTFAGLDVFSRCMECNGSCFVQAPGPVIQALFENNVTCRNGFHDEPFNVVGWTERLSSLDCRDFAGIGCRLLSANEEHMVMQCHGGVVYITANIVKHDHFEEGVDILVRKLSDYFFHYFVLLFF
ncbi:hypothetical protein Y032_0047g1485 [Ancylostoma ceylanicum]|uniref:3'-5' exonuclease domain-containing protein n=1 Tax=Ancylostoma ceylanicum TaxID=53326 RepID=A0A016UBY4_9BILA|nr:hypothetical protein Y032_0047g1485 [Ancylostoma ceylanicum]